MSINPLLCLLCRFSQDHTAAVELFKWADGNRQGRTGGTRCGWPVERVHLENPGWALKYHSRNLTPIHY